jgi:hypothetical protein
MRPLKMLVWSVAIASMASMVVSSQSRGPAGAVLYEGPRVIVGDGSAPIEGAAFVVQNGRISAIGRQGRCQGARGRRSGGSRRQDRDARADQRARAHRL